VLGVQVPRRTIPVAPGRNLAVLVEAAIRDQILRADGYSASKDLVQKQAEALAGNARNLQEYYTNRPKSGIESTPQQEPD